MPCVDGEVITEMKGYRKILIAVNGSLEVLKTGLKIAQDEGCWVTIVKVIPPYEGELHLTGIKNIEDVLDSYGARTISNINGIAKKEGVLIKTRLEQGEIYKKILEVAEEEMCDIIIVGANKTNWFKKILGRDVVEKVISHAPCPVLVVKS